MDPLSDGKITQLVASGGRSSGRWILAAGPSEPQASREWQEVGAAWLRPGELFGAITVPADLVHAAIGLAEPPKCAAPLAELLEGGPVFFTQAGFGRGPSYTALVPAAAGMRWAMVGTMAHPHRALLHVPAPDVQEHRDEGPWWVVPPSGPGVLCPPHRLTALVTVGQNVLSGSHDAAGRRDNTTAIAASPVYTETLPRVPESARSARCLVSSALSAWGLENVADAAQLVVSELVANAFVHASGPRIRVTVTRQDRTSVRVAVVDESQALPRSRSVGDQAESGRGLALVAAHCGGQWGVELLDQGGKAIWAIVAAGDHSTPR
ncbi:ATP-binding protein [Streptomyces sp. NPDC059256]|uniref:ATP-binding protein n=1 Tax=Streptomyces sp. NPDC059256 TaxID=3346794 RepID=UPI0036B1A92B